MPLTTDRPNAPADDDVAPPDAIRDALHKFAELRAYALQFIAAKRDLTRLKLRRVVFALVLGILGLVCLLATIVILLAMLFTGLAGAVAAITGGRVWVGNLAVAAIFLGLFVAGTMIGLRSLKKVWFRSTVAKYELQQRQQVDAFGRSSRDRTAAEGSVKV